MTSQRVSGMVSMQLGGLGIQNSAVGAVAPARSGTVGLNGGSRQRRARCLRHFFEATCDRMPDHVALDDGVRRVTYRQLDEQANQLSHLLRGRGIGTESRVGILLHRSAQTYISLLAILKAGAAFVPIDPSSPPDRVRYIAEDSGLDLLITSTDLARSSANRLCPVLILDTASTALRTCPSTRPTIEVDGDATCYVIYTSGSSGQPKGVEVTRSSICNFIDIVPGIYDVRSTDRVYQGMTIAFDFSIEEIWPTFAVGATLIVGPNDSRHLGLELGDFLNDTGVTVFYCVPTLLATISRDLPKVRSLIVGGEACPADLVKRWNRPGRRILNTYGPTEATVTATCGELVPDRPVTIGRPLPTYEVVLLDDELRPVPAGGIGEICIGGPGVARGYVGRPELTAERFVVHPLASNGGRLYRSGDLGRWLGNGEIEYCGRADAQVKIRGHRVELAEIESVLAGTPGIAQAAVGTFEPEPGLVELVGYYSLRAEATSVSEERLYEVLRAHLPPYMVPAYLEQLAVIPTLPSDKIDRKLLPVPKGPRSIARQSRYVPPASDTERALADVLGRVLHVERLSVDSHFFNDLGANSLLMAHFCTRVRERADLPPMSMKDVYLYPTIRGLAASFLDAAPAAASSPAAVVRQAPRASTRQYVLCAALQLLLFLAAAYLGTLGSIVGVRWITAADHLGEVFVRSLVVTDVAFVGMCVAPILVKWLFVGRWKVQEIPVWSLAYVGFWIVKTLMRFSPAVLFVGSPLYVLYLRALGAKIGRDVAIFSRNVPVCTDLLTVGDGTVIGKDSYFNCYRVEGNLLQTGRVSLGKDVIVGEKTVLEIASSMNDGAQLGHASSLHRSQVVPEGECWHGSPAQPAEANYRRIRPAACGTLRKVSYSVTQLLNRLVLGGPLVISIAVEASTEIPLLASLAGPTNADIGSWTFYHDALAVSFVVFLGGLLLRLLLVLSVPRVLNLAIKPDRVYALYGAHYWLQRTIARLTNARIYMTLFGDSVYVVHYLRALGYKLPAVVQTGSNFGTEQKHESPYLTTIGTATMVSDGLSVMNAEFSNTSFRTRHVLINSHSFFGNDIVYPVASKVGDNCLLGTKTMVPIDGKVRQDVGLLGSPPFEIPRSVQRDSSFDHLKSGEDFHRRLADKTKHNTATIGLFLLLRWMQFYVTTLVLLVAVDRHGERFGSVVVTLAAMVIVVFGVTSSVLIERAATGFRRLTSQFCSIYDPYFWRHERFWKLSAEGLAMFNGTPFKSLIWRGLGVRLGGRLFDDGCSMPEKTLVALGRDCTLNAGSVIQCHSLEDGTFKSDRITIGAGCTLGVGAFTHYGVRIGDGAVLDTDSFLMKGEDVPPLARWGGNPARQMRHTPTDRARHCRVSAG